MDITKTLFPYTGKWIPLCYNKIFHPNLCHVCKKTREETNLTTCDRCFFISYCSEDHKNLHLPQHREICIAMEKFLKNNPQYLTRRLSLNKWMDAQIEFCQSVKENLRRVLEKYEMQMLTFARSCIICHQQTGLYSCKTCLSVDYCLEHKKKFEQKHQQRSCNRLIMWLNLELSNIQYESEASLLLKFTKFPTYPRFFNDMTEFIEKYVQNQPSEWSVLDYNYTDYLSGPLSVYYIMLQAKLSYIPLLGPTCIIHIVEADSVERNGLPAWEILLHLFPNIQILVVVLLGIELQFELGSQEICSRCVCNKKKFIYECCSTTYRNYMDNPMYGKPKLIVALQTLFISKSPLYIQLKTMQSQECPVLLVVSFRETMLREIAEIKKVLGEDVCPIINIENKFGSLRPHRLFKSTYYRNSFLIVYKTLKNTSSVTKALTINI
ncbi:uncharacterized protein LOC105185056 [Harpegnathos saltator]|uniref:uncharacterized protein LOC105185056 n=1 Tax=Harpegnathos saltator TaxID=610380 RepID=UPI000DBED400|nr:uncharacterized protein LOC105185056 [Harpegnathos saltator]